MVASRRCWRSSVMRIPTRCLAAKDSRAFRPQVRSPTIGTLYGTRDNGRSGDPVKILRRNYANKCSVRSSRRANAMPLFGSWAIICNATSHVGSTLESRHLAIHSNAPMRKSWFAYEVRGRVARLSLLEARREFFRHAGKQIAAKNTHRAFGWCPAARERAKYGSQCGETFLCESRPYLTSLRNGEVFRRLASYIADLQWAGSHRHTVYMHSAGAAHGDAAAITGTQRNRDRHTHGGVGVMPDKDCPSRCRERQKQTQ